MTIKVRYFAILADEAGCEGETVDWRAGSLADLYDQLREKHGFRLPRKAVRAAMDDEFCDWEQAPQEGAIVAFIPPVSGG